MSKIEFKWVEHDGFEVCEVGPLTLVAHPGHAEVWVKSEQSSSPVCFFTDGVESGKAILEKAATAFAMKAPDEFEGLSNG